MPISTYISPFGGGRVLARAKIKASFVSVQTAFFDDIVRDGLADRHLSLAEEIARAEAASDAAL